MKRRLISLLLCLGICLSLTIPCFAYSGVSSWAEAEIAQAADLGFLPESLEDEDLSQPMTRLEMCQLAVNAFERITGTTLYPASNEHFSDTYHPDVCIAYELDIVSGYPDGTFLPDKQMTRQEFSRIMTNLLTVLKWTEQSHQLSRFSDLSQLDSWAQEAAATVISLGIVNGNTDGTLNPTGNTSMEQALVMFLRAYDVLAAMQGDDDAGIAPPADPVDYVPTYTCSSWALEALQRMDMMGLIPESIRTADMTTPINRSQMCEVAVLTYGYLTGTTAAPLGSHFTDTEAAAINAAYELGIVSGFPDGTFLPANLLTRQQFFQISFNLLNVCGWTRPTDSELLVAVFSDAAQISDWAQSSVATLYRLGIMQGNSNGTVMPLSNTSRQQAIILFLRTYLAICSWYEQNPLTEIVGPNTSASQVEILINYALSLEGYPYTWAGTSPETGFDCSGFIYHVYNHCGYDLPRTVSYMMNYGTLVPRAEMRPGDILVFANNGTTSITHVGLYLGDNMMIHAANPSRGVVIDKIDYDHNKYLYAVIRIIE